MFAFVTIVEPQIDSLNTARKGALKSHIFGGPKAGDRWNVPVLWDGVAGRIAGLVPFVDIAEAFRFLEPTFGTPKMPLFDAPLRAVFRLSN